MRNNRQILRFVHKKMRKSLANGNPNSDAEAKSPRRPSLLELYASQDIIVLQI